MSHVMGISSTDFETRIVRCGTFSRREREDLDWGTDHPYPTETISSRFAAPRWRPAYGQHTHDLLEGFVPGDTRVARRCAALPAG